MSASSAPTRRSRDSASRGERVAPSAHAGATLIARHLGLVLWLLGVVVLVIMAVAAHQYREFPGDAGLSAQIDQLRRSPLYGVITFPAQADAPKPGGVIGIAMLAALLAMRRVIEAVGLALASFGADLVNVIINLLVARPRPGGVQVETLGGLGRYSFPSGHVVHVVGLFGFVLILSILVVRSHPAGRWWALPIQIVCVYLLALIGIGRVALGAHWPSDVLAGYLLGALMLALAVRVYLWLAAWWARRAGRHHTPAA